MDESASKGQGQKTLNYKGVQVSFNAGETQKTQETQDIAAGQSPAENKVLTFKDQVLELLQGLFKEQNKNKQQFAKSIQLVQKMQKNIIEHPSEDKFKRINPNNPKIREPLTQYYNGTQLLKLIGFQEFYDPQNKETVLKIPPTMSTTYIKGQKLDFESVLNSYMSTL